MHLLQVDVGRSLTTITEGSVAGLHVSLVERFVACPHTGTLMSYYVPCFSGGQSAAKDRIYPWELDVITCQSYQHLR